MFRAQIFINWKKASQIAPDNSTRKRFRKKAVMGTSHVVSPPHQTLLPECEFMVLWGQYSASKEKNKCISASIHHQILYLSGGMDETVRTDILQLLIFPLVSLFHPVQTLAYIFFKRKHIHPHMCFCIHFLHFFCTSISYKKSIFVYIFLNCKMKPKTLKSINIGI